MTNEYTKSVDELARRRKSQDAYGAQGRADLHARAQTEERRKLRRAFAVCVIALIVLAIAAYHVFYGPVSR